MTTSTRRRRARRAATTGIAAAAATALAAPLAFAAPGPGAGGIGDPYYPAYGNGGYDVSNYNLFVDYVPTTGRITGTAIIPTKKGDTSAAMAVAPYASPICPSSKCNPWPRYVPMVTNQLPQMKYWRNIMTESENRVDIKQGW